MPVTYRLLHADEIDAAADLWRDLNTDPVQHDAWRREFRSLPDLLTHTRVAVASDGALLSTIHYWPLTVYGAPGQSWKAGWLSHVFTHPAARRQRHASRLLELTIAAMRAEGCIWSLLRTSDEARPLYERYGWRSLPVRQFACVAPHLSERTGRYSVRACEPAQEAGGWDALAAIHRAYNTGRPLTAIRDAAYWRYIAVRVGWWLASGQARVFVAANGRHDGAVCAYAIAAFSTRGFLVAEVGARPDTADALPALLSAVIGHADGHNPNGRLYLPRDSSLEATLMTLCIHVEDNWDDTYMVRAIAPGFDARLLDPLPAAPGAVAWMLY